MQHPPTFDGRGQNGVGFHFRQHTGQHGQQQTLNTCTGTSDQIQQQLHPLLIVKASDRFGAAQRQEQTTQTPAIITRHSFFAQCTETGKAEKEKAKEAVSQPSKQAKEAVSQPIKQSTKQASNQTSKQTNTRVTILPGVGTTGQRQYIHGRQ